MRVHPFVSTGQWGVSNPIPRDPERLVSCNAIFFDPRGRAIYIYIYRLVLHTRNTRSVEDDGENSSLHFDPCEYTRCCVQSLEEK